MVRISNQQKEWYSFFSCVQWISNDLSPVLNSGSHSTLNVLRKANDSKNALCATALSFIAYLKPDYLFFENV
jgi:hypothetical protein